MKKKRNIFDIILDPEEKEILESVEQGEWRTVDNFKEEAALAKKAAKNFLRKDERATLRLSQGDQQCL